jgi:hypothetical protein
MLSPVQKIKLTFHFTQMIKVCARLIVFWSTILFFSFEVLAQQATVNTVWNDYERVLQASGFVAPHNLSDQPYSYRYWEKMYENYDHPWSALHLPYKNVTKGEHWGITLYSPETGMYWRNRRPGGINDGAIWQGKGLTTYFSTGIHGRYRFISAAFQPQFIYTENRNYPLSRYPARSEFSEYGSPFYNIDLPQRFGNTSFTTYDPGPSFIRVDSKGFEAGLSNEHRWWGPAVHYPILMSNNAPGFWHYFAGTSEPKDIYIGNLEATIIWGKLWESDYFDEHWFNDERYITGMSISFTPKVTPGLTIGLSRVFYRVLPPEGIPVRDLFKVFEGFTKVGFSSSDNQAGDDRYSQMASIHGRWVFPESGFEIYGEYARNDHSWDFRDLIGEPEHSRAYMIGFQKSFMLSESRILAINAELVQTEASKTRNFRTDSSYYTHYIVTQGYTHRGQLLGFGHGPGANAQRLEAKYYFEKGRLSAWARRAVFDNDFFYRSDIMLQEPENSGMQKYWLHNFEVGGGVSIVYFFNRYEAEVGLELTKEFNEDFLYQNDLVHATFQFRMRYLIGASSN